jgi:cytosol alanyl aminopeptidase
MKQKLLLLAMVGLLMSACKGKPPEQPTPKNQPTASQPTAKPQAPEAVVPLRLSDTIIPQRYNVDLTLDPNLPTFSGVVEVTLKLSQKTTAIMMHATEIDLQRAIVRAGSQQQQGKWVRLNSDTISISFPEALNPGEATLVLSYTGKVSEQDTHGIFRQQESGRWYLMTQFEATDARRAFPCFDEPSFKTPWKLTFHIPKGLTAVANTPLEEEKETLKDKEVKFMESKPLPSYLIAFGVGDYDIIDVGTAGKNKTALRILAPKGRGGEAQYPKEIMGQILETAEDYVGIPYPFEKLDFLVFPESVGFSAMENPGLITYASRVLLAKPTEQTIRYQRRCASVISHEIAHLWFGDLVTPYFWDDIWLNESFASWAGDLVLSRWKPALPTQEWSVDSRLGVMGLDSLSTARKIRQPILSKDDIENAFDRITYSKGKAVLQMFEAWLGEKQFQTIIRSYLTKHSYKNASATDFIASIAEVAGAEAGAAFSTFIEQEGVPLLTAKLSCEKGQPPSVSLQQERFIPLGSSASKERTWGLPVCVRYPVGKATEVECVLLSKDIGSLSLTKTKTCPAWILPNANATGYYHSRYDANLLQKLISTKQLSTAEKLEAWGDTRALVAKGDVPLGDVLALLPDLMKNPGSAFTIRAADMMAGLRFWLVPPEAFVNYQKLLQKWFGAKQKALGFASSKSEDSAVSLLRPTLLMLIGNAGDSVSLQQAAAKKAAEWLTNKQAIEAEIVGEVLVLAARGGDRKLFDSFVAEVKQNTERRERRSIYSMLGGFNDAALTQEALSLITADGLDIKESIAILWAVSDNPKNASLAYDFVTKNFEALSAKMPRESIAGLIRVGGVFCEESKMSEVEAFFKDISTKHTGGPRILSQTLEGISLCSTYRKTQEASVAAFLKK